MTTRISLHKNYWIGILASIVICLLTIRYTPDTQLKDYVSFAATLASLILAILAIIQAMYSSSSLNNTISSLKDSSKNISKQTNSLHYVIEELQSKIIALPLEVENRVNTQLSQILNRKVQTDLKNEESEKEQVALTQQMNDKYFENYINLGSVNGLLLLHAIRLSIKHSKLFKLTDLLPEDVRPSNIDNMLGYLTSHTAAGFAITIYDGNLVKFENLVIKSETIDSSINLFLTNNIQPDLVAFFIKVKNQIDDFFKD